VYAVSLALALLAAAPGPSRTAPVGAEVPAAPRVVLGLTGAPAPFSAERCATVLRGHIDGEAAVLPIDGEPYAWSRTSAGERAGEVMWLEIRVPGPHRLYLFAPATDRVYVRELADPGDPEALLESLGVVIHALLSAVAAGEPPAGMRPVEPESAPPPEPVKEPAKQPVKEPVMPPVRARARVELAVAYLGRSLVAGAPWQSGIGARVGVIAPRGLVASLGGGWLAPARLDSTVALELRRAPFDAQVGYRLRRERALAIDVTAGVALERLAWTVTGPAEARAQGPSQALRVGLGPAVGLVWRAWRGLEVRLHARMDAWVRDARLQVATPEGPRTALAPPRVSAGVDAGLGWVF
jgi:hypothetical protein